MWVRLPARNVVSEYTFMETVDILSMLGRGYSGEGQAPCLFHDLYPGRPIPDRKMFPGID